MKQSILLIGLAFVTISTFSQGTVRFNNRPASGDARVTLPDGRGAGAIGMTAQLFLVGAGGVLTPLTPTTTFRTSSPAAEYFINEVIVTVPGIPAGSPATLRMRVFQGPSFDAAGAGGLLRGETSDVTVPQLGGTPAVGAPIPDPELTGLPGIGILPEPSTMTLGLLGAAALLFRRRKS